MLCECSSNPKITGSARTAFFSCMIGRYEKIMSIYQETFLYFGDNQTQRSQNVEIAQPPKGVRRGADSEA